MFERAVAPMLTVLLASTVSAAGQNDDTLDPTGYWLTENERSIIHLSECDEGLCGEIAWIIEDGMRYDRENPEPAKRERELCGLQIIQGLEPDPDQPGRWIDGDVYNAEDGETYNLLVRVQDHEPDTLRVRGYVGMSIFGQTQEWSRVSADDYERCEPPG